MSDPKDIEVVRGAYLRAVRALGQGNLSDEAVRALVGGDVGFAVDSLAWQQFREELQVAGETMRRSLFLGGEAAGDAILGVDVRLQFDRVNPRTVAVVERQAGQMITHLDTNARVALKAELKRAVSGGATAQELIERLQSVVGLHPRQARQVEAVRLRSYEEMIARGFDDKQARQQAARAAGRVSTRVQTYRATVVARTELARAQNTGRWLGWLQADEEGLVDMTTYGKRWSAALDACQVCLPLHGTTEPASYVYAHGSEMPPAHPQCRCSASLIPPGRIGWNPTTATPKPPFSAQRIVDY